MAAQSIDSATLSINRTDKTTHSVSSPEERSTAQVKESSNSSLQQVSQRKLNVAILQSHQEVSLGIKDEPLALVYKTAIENINKELEEELGENAIQKGYESGLDVSPEATAERIVSFSTSLFPLFQQQHPSLSEEEQVNRFLDVIGGGIDQGFSEAREILDGLGVLEGEIAVNIDKTYNLVQDGLTAFRDRFEPAVSNEAIESEE